MSHVYESSADNLVFSDVPSFLKRSSVLFYGLMSYTIGMAGLVWLILAFGGLAPSGLITLSAESSAFAMLVNAGLIVLLGLQHSIMARHAFKNWLKQYLPEAAERATFVLLSGIATLMVIVFWQPLPGIVWNIENAIGQGLLWGLYGLGWGYLVLSTFITNHFELMGLRQVYLYFSNKAYTQIPFTRKYMYSYSRHPMMLGVLVGMWAIPEMSISHFVMAMLLTIYMAVGVFLEERDLVKQFGDTYRHYRKEIATFIPRLF